MSLVGLIRSDLKRYSCGTSFWSFVFAWLRYPGFNFSVSLRLCGVLRQYRLLKFFMFPFFVWHMHLRKVTGVQIGWGTRIGPGLYIPHIGTIVVNPRTEIGCRCYLSHGVTLGKVHAGQKEGVPRIGDDVFFGVGCVVLGNVSVGDNSAIGPNSVVIDSVPAGSFAAGAPARVLAVKTATEILGYESGGNDD